MWQKCRPCRAYVGSSAEIYYFVDPLVIERWVGKLGREYRRASVTRMCAREGRGLPSGGWATNQYLSLWWILPTEQNYHGKRQRLCGLISV